MRRALFGGGILILIVIFITQMLPTPAQATVPSIWGSTFNIASNEIVLPTDRNTAECSYANMRLRLFSAGNATSPSDLAFLPSKEVASTPKDLCVVRGSHGTFSAAQGYWAPTNNLDDVLQIENVAIIPVPDSNAVLFMNIFGSDPGGFRVSINYNLPAIGRLEAGYAGTGNNRVKYKKWWVTSSALHMHFSNNSAMTFKKWAFSENGKYGIAAMFSGMLVRVNMQTQEIQPIKQLPSNKPNWQLGISNDGNYALSYESSSSAPSFHDLTGCQAQYVKGTYPASGANTAGCVTTSLQSRLQALYPGVVMALMNNFRFGSNASSFSVDTFWRTTPSEITKRRVEFRAEGYTPQNEGYLALGDSFSSGEGDLQGGVWYEPGTDEQGNKDTFDGRNLCHLSRRSYPYLIAKELGYLLGDISLPTTPDDSGLFHSVACSGAIMNNMTGSQGDLRLIIGNTDDFATSQNQYSNNYLGELGRWQPGRIKQLDRLDSTVFGGYTSSESLPEVITVGIAGNDAGFGDTIKACTMPGTCKQAMSGSTDASNLAVRLMKLKPKLVETYTSIKTASPDSRIYVHGYPIFVNAGGDCGMNVLLDSSETRLVEEGVMYMNQIVRAAALEAGVYYVDIEDILTGANLCSGANDSNMAVNGVTAGNDIDFKLCIFRTGCLGSESFHPNPTAHKLYSERILLATNDLESAMPAPQKQNTPTPSSFFGSTAVSAAGTINNGANYSVVIPEPKSFLQGTEQGLQIVQSGLLPSTVLKVELQSTPTTIAEFTVPANGEIKQAITPPPNAEPGAHELHIFGTTNFGVGFDYYEPIAIAFSETDFDGDGILNDVDSCVTVVNSFVDIDIDGIDDTCDPESAAPIVEEQPPEEEQPPQDDTSENPEVVQVPDIDKGRPNPETVAGDEDITGPQVLGETTTSTSEDVLGVATTLVNTGNEVIANVAVGLLIVASVWVVKLRTRG